MMHGWIRRLLTLTLVAAVGMGLVACNGEKPAPPDNEPAQQEQPAADPPSSDHVVVGVDEQPSDVYYEIFVRAFADSDKDGIGDLQGLIQKLDYLNDGDTSGGDDLGVGGIWLMPVNASPSYHGYDVTDYYAINPEYGTVEDFQQFIEEAHKRGIKVIMDLVVNHTSKEHPWFVASATEPEGEYRDWYVWAEDQGRAVTGTSAASGGNPWHASREGHYLGAFWEGMPDLNFDHQPVRDEMIKIGQYWLELGVDGFRLDAAKHIYEDLGSDRGEATVKKNLEWWNAFRDAMEAVNPDVYILGEVWEDSPVNVAPYFESFDSSFNFGLGQQMVKAAASESSLNMAFTLDRIYALYEKASAGEFVDAAFLTNHDQDRVMSQLGGNVDRMKMATGLLLTIPGNPFLYYGEEIGMQGRKPDEYIREPFLWTADGSDPLQTSWITSRYNVDAPPSVTAQMDDPDSLLSRYRELIGWRNEEPALQDGDITRYDLDNGKVESFVRLTAEERVLVVHNLSGEAQTVDLTVGADGGAVPFTELARSTSEDAALEGTQLTVPPYTSVLLK